MIRNENARYTQIDICTHPSVSWIDIGTLKLLLQKPVPTKNKFNWIVSIKGENEKIVFIYQATNW